MKAPEGKENRTPQPNKNRAKTEASAASQSAARKYVSSKRSTPFASTPQVKKTPKKAAQKKAKKLEVAPEPTDVGVEDVTADDFVVGAPSQPEGETDTPSLTDADTLFCTLELLGEL